jgi:hypothetical protein
MLFMFSLRKFYQQKKLQITLKLFNYGWMTGFEPATLGTTNRCSNQLSYNHHLFNECKYTGNLDYCK